MRGCSFPECLEINTTYLTLLISSKVVLIEHGICIYTTREESLRDFQFDQRISRKSHWLFSVTLLVYQ